MASPKLYRFTDSFLPSPRFFSGSTTNALVPDIFPVAIDGRPFLIDFKSNLMTRSFEARVRDSVDQSTSPGEAAINPQGLWRRGETSWHAGAGQKYSDTADSAEYRFYSSKGINPWTKGELTLLNATKSVLTSSNTNLKMVVANSSVYVTDGTAVKYSTDPFAATPTWTAITGLPSLTPRDIASDGQNVYLTYAGTTSSFGLWKVDSSRVATNLAHGTGHELGNISFAKGHLMVSGATAADSIDIYYDPAGSIGTDSYSHPIPGWTWTNFAAGQNAIYAAGYVGDRGAIYKITITAAGILDQPVVALELPIGEIPQVIEGYLGAILIGTNKGVRYATTDSQANLTSGALIPTPNAVKAFTFEDRYAWFTWSNYDGTSTGLGRLDLGTFIAVNTPAYATDLMTAATANVTSVITFAKKRLFAVTGIGFFGEDTDNLVTSGQIITGTYRWGIPDRKFIAKFDLRSQPLVGTISPYISLDSADYVTLSPHSTTGTSEAVATGPQTKFIEAKIKIELTRATATTGPTLTRWMARAYATPARSQVFRVPLLMHHTLRLKDSDYYMDVDTELINLRDLVTNPRVITYQENNESFSVIVEDMEFQVIDGYQQNWDLEGTCTVTMRSVQD
jgi:hypothetical protein